MIERRRKKCWWGGWQSCRRRGCHYQRNSNGVRKNTERQVTSSQRYAKEEVIRGNKVDKVLHSL